jgi:hypothetical protein
LTVRKRVFDLERKSSREEIVGRPLGALLGESDGSWGTTLEADPE